MRLTTRVIFQVKRTLRLFGLFINVLKAIFYIILYVYMATLTGTIKIYFKPAAYVSDLL